MVSMAVLIRTFSSGIYTHHVSWNCAHHLRMELSDGGCFPNLVWNCRWTVVPRQSFWITLYILTPWCRVLLMKLTGLQASQETPRISRNPKVHYRTLKRPPPVSILGQPNPVHIPTSHLLEIHPNIIHPSRPWSPQLSPSIRFPHQDPIHPLNSPIRATCPAHLILLDFITRTILGEEYKNPVYMCIYMYIYIYICISF